MELDSRKKSKRDRMMRSNSFDTQNARVGKIRTQIRESRNLERGRGVKIGFLNADKVNRMGREKVK